MAFKIENGRIQEDRKSRDARFKRAIATLEKHGHGGSLEARLLRIAIGTCPAHVEGHDEKGCNCKRWF